MKLKKRIKQTIKELKKILNAFETNCDDVAFETTVDDSDLEWVPYGELNWALYHNAVGNLMNGRPFWAILLTENYKFDEHHTLKDLFSCSIWEVAEADIKVEEDRLTIEKIEFNNFTDSVNIICGIALYNQSGAIAYLNCNKTLTKGNSFIMKRSSEE